MAVIVGTTGSVVVTGSPVGISLTGSDRTATNANMRVTRWAGSIDQGTVDSTGFAPVSNSRSTLLDGLPVMTGTFEGFLDATNTIDESDFNDATPTVGAFELLASDTGTADQEVRYTFNGWITGITLGAAVGELNRFTASFKSTGDITSVATEPV